MLIDTAVGPWRAMAARPWRFLASGLPWRSLAYLACGGYAALPLLALAVWLRTVPSEWATAGAVALLVAAGLAAAGPVARVELRRLRIVDAGRAAPVPGRAAWRRLAYALLLMTVLSPSGAVAVVGVLSLVLTPVGAVLVVLLEDATPVEVPSSSAAAAALWLVLIPLAAYAVTALAAAHAAVARRLLVDGDTPLTVQVQELTRSRTRLVDAFEAERSRIERDLHDGAQQRLVALIMTLGLAELTVAERGVDAAVLLERARHEAEAVLVELRELIRGIHPQVLTDRGIEAAVTEIVDRCPLPVTVRVDLPGRPARLVESIAYFAVSEALANVVKHARATHAEVAMRAVRDRLVLTVRDTGVGGADPTGGSGIQGLVDRVAVVGGTVRLTSPPGGPTELCLEMPWRVADSA